jgi:hypothetical protein
MRDRHDIRSPFFFNTVPMECTKNRVCDQPIILRRTDPDSLPGDAHRPAFSPKKSFSLPVGVDPCEFVVQQHVYPEMKTEVFIA